MAIQTNSDVAAKVRGVIAEKKVRQTVVARELKLSRMSVHRRLNGETPLAPEELILIASICSVPVGRFFGEAEQ